VPDDARLPEFGDLPVAEAEPGAEDLVGVLAQHGAGARTAPGVSESLTGTPIIFTVPAVGCAVSTIMPRALTCGCATT
jgi:hypothetical protein